MSAHKISRQLVDPELIDFAERLPVQSLDGLSLAAARQTTLNAEFALSPGVSLTEIFVPGPEPMQQCRLLILTPASAKASAPCLFFIHGGGYVLGSPETVVTSASELASACSCIVALPSYRLAPEAPWPAPVDDLYAQLTWLHRYGDGYGIDRGQIAIGGASAGGGHAARLSLRARDENSPPIVFQLLLSPMLDDRQPHNPYLGEYVWTRDHDRFGWDSLLGAALHDPEAIKHAVPNRVASLSGLPPTYISIGALDLFTESCLQFSGRLMACGVSTELHVIPGGYHGFEYFVPGSAISRRATAEVVTVLNAVFAKANASPV